MSKIDDCVFTESYLRRAPHMRAVAERHGKIENDLTPAQKKKRLSRAEREAAAAERRIAKAEKAVENAADPGEKKAAKDEIKDAQKAAESAGVAVSAAKKKRARRKGK